ncbi:ArsR family transcriptional regulator, partial [bacterium]
MHGHGEQQQALKDREAYARVAAVLNALSSPLRLEIVELLAQCDRSVDALAKKCNQPLKNVSHHLQKLHAAGVVDRRTEGRKVTYSLAHESVATFWSQARIFAEERAANLISRSGGEGVPTVTGELTPKLLDELLAGKKVTVIDVRPPEEYHAGHLPGSRSVPLDSLEEHMQEFPRDRPVVAYCRGRYCLLADVAVDLL